MLLGDEDDACEDCREKPYRPNCDPACPCPYTAGLEDNGYFSDDFYGDDLDGWDDPCELCGSWCEHWGGDGICTFEIDYLIAEDEKREVEDAKE